MALFSGSRDVSLIRRVNRELMHRVISTEVAVYKFSVEHSKENIYGESSNKVFYNPVRVYALIDRDDKSNISEEDILNYTRKVSFGFLRDDLRDKNLVVQEGDVVEWDTEYYELSLVTSGQLWSGKNPETLFATVVDKEDEFGYKISVVAQGFKVTPEKIGITSIRSR